MLRHSFQPGRLVAGVFLTATGVIYAGDAGGLWDVPRFLIVPLVTAGLCLAGAVGTLAGAVRRHRRTLPPDAGTRTDTGGTGADLPG
ncbi:hypothetical protein AB0O68_11945 [Streptomyces sp. NPDC087512]|uniref:hypothetical protein n=1 Tax=Streptomyces sp. NPDC087512 TaxID=3155059 RepID=UPI003417DD43